MELGHPSRRSSSEGATQAKPWPFLPLACPEESPYPRFNFTLCTCFIFFFQFPLSAGWALAACPPALRGPHADLALLRICVCTQSSIEDGFQFAYLKAFSPTPRLLVHLNHCIYAVAASDWNSFQTTQAWNHMISTPILLQLLPPELNRFVSIKQIFFDVHGPKSWSLFTDTSFFLSSINTSISYILWRENRGKNWHFGIWIFKISKLSFIIISNSSNINNWPS